MEIESRKLVQIKAEEETAKITFSEAYSHFRSSLTGEGHKKSVHSRYTNHLQPAFGGEPMYT